MTDNYVLMSKVRLNKCGLYMSCGLSIGRFLFINLGDFPGCGLYMGCGLYEQKYGNLKRLCN